MIGSAPITILAHVEETAHGGDLGVVVRLGPVSAVAAVAAWAAVMRLSAARDRGLAASGAAVGFGLAGALHLALVPSHARDGALGGVFFAAAGIGELLLAWRMAVQRPVRRATAAVGVVLVVVLLAVYVASRVWASPFDEAEPVDALGVMSKLLEAAAAALGVVAAQPWCPRLPAPNQALAGLAVVTALLARPLFDLGPRPIAVAAAVAGALGVHRLAGREDASPALMDGALLALVLRGDTPWWALLAGGAAAAVARRAQRRWGGALVPPVAVAALGVLWAMPPARFEILHVSHPDDALGAAAGFAIATAVTVAAWQSGRLPVVVAFLGAHLAAQVVRLALDRTSVEAIEVPGFSLGLFLLAALAVTGPAAAGARVAVAGAALAGLVDVVLRDLDVAYAPLLALAFAGLVMAAVRVVQPAPRIADTPHRQRTRAGPRTGSCAEQTEDGAMPS
jgi:hypothetical protein